RGRPDEGRRDRHLQVRRGTDPWTHRRRRAPGPGGADGAARAVGQHVEPPRLAPGPHARATAPARAGGGRGRGATAWRGERRSTGNPGTRTARRRGLSLATALALPGSGRARLCRLLPVG